MTEKEKLDKEKEKNLTMNVLNRHLRLSKIFHYGAIFILLLLLPFIALLTLITVIK